ncbi:MAG: peptidoglycan DD-metalloendopeptidase family protein [Cellvibrionaceae bacterium]
MIAPKRQTYIPYKHLFLVILLAVIAIVHWLYTPQAVSMAPSPVAVTTLDLPLEAQNIHQSEDKLEVLDQNTVVPTEPPPRKNEEEVIIRQGDTLSTLFDRYDLGQTTLRAILSADESLLALETVRPGQIIYFRYEENTRYLKEMELYRHAGHRIIYKRVDAKVFEYETIIQEGVWENKRIDGKIQNTFYLSAQVAGLTEKEAATITRIFQDQLNFSRAIRKGDLFQIIRGVQTIEGKPTGQTRIESVRIKRRAYEHTAFLFKDGRYYDKKGKSLARAFRRTPLNKRYRVSSRFNPKRVHPVTGRVGPHNGTDFATPTGTKVLSTGDGVVARVGNHPFAGKYIDIQHGGQYKTRYLHLHKILVRRGEPVSRGQAIALSGNSGRSTGAHLHFELHIHGRPVDPMKAKIPITQSVPKKDKVSFAQRVKEQTLLLDELSDVTEVAVKESE